ncbi:MAG TPA: heme ABC transporter ATP-binding protein [Pseudolabrys sp.]|nr:heme ABC transporter ATP-binding protein [Pseudolabrys sp.]
MSALLEAQALSVRINGKALLDSVSLAVEAGESVALVGPNGAGKATLLRALSGEIAASGGAIRLKGRALHTYRPRALALHRAMLSQSVSVSFPFTVAEVVRMGAADMRSTAVDAQVDAALSEVDLSGFQNRIINTLSGGEQLRAHFARVLVQLACGEVLHGPGLLLLDEPTASLDLRHQLDLLAAIRRRAEQGSTIVTVVHDLNLAVLLARRVIVLGRGRIEADGPPQHSITDDVLERVFGVARAVDRFPQPGLPFVLPHGARRTAQAG